MIDSASYAGGNFSSRADRRLGSAWMFDASTRLNGEPTSVEHCDGFDLLDPSLEIFHRFVEHLVIKSAKEPPDQAQRSLLIDWAALRASAASCTSLEQGIGRALVAADLMSRGGFQCADAVELRTDETTTNTFFDFSVIDATPDFGDQDRYRTRVARRLGSVLGPRIGREAEPDASSLIFEPSRQSGRSNSADTGS